MYKPMILVSPCIEKQEKILNSIRSSTWTYNNNNFVLDGCILQESKDVDLISLVDIDGHEVVINVSQYGAAIIENITTDELKAMIKLITGFDMHFVYVAMIDDCVMGVYENIYDLLNMFQDNFGRKRFSIISTGDMDFGYIDRDNMMRHLYAIACVPGETFIDGKKV